MTNHPHTTGETLEQLLERIIFEDPVTHRLRDEWEQAKRTEQEVFERVCREEYERRLEYHQICQTPEPEATARRETHLCAILFQEELDGRLSILWADIMRRLQAVLANKAAEAEENERPQLS
jgi:hypothetical protein